MTMQFGTKKTFKTWLYSWVAVLILLVVCIFLAMSVWERFVIEREMSARKEAIELEYTTLYEQKKALEERVEYLSGERGVEEELRRNFDVARPGEQVVILTGEPTKEAPSSTEDEALATPWYVFWR